MKTYIGLYTGDSCRTVIKDTLRTMGGRVDVVIVDTMYDDGYLSLAEELRNMGYPVKLYALDKVDFDSIGNKISAICKEGELDALVNEKENPKYFIEVGGLDHIMSGAMYTAAYNTGNTIVYTDEERVLREIRYEGVPDVAQVRYIPGKVLDVLYEDGDMDVMGLSKKVYADRIVNMNEEQIKEFFNKNHNTYKAIENVRDKGWIRIEKSTKKYQLTERGNLARVLINLRDEKKKMKISEFSN